MRTVTLEYKVYKYDELSTKAKEKVKQWYLDNQSPSFFTEMVVEDLRNLFGKNNLDIQYSLSYCQGDGLNIYGKIDAESIFNCLDNNNGGSQLEKFKNYLTDKEKKSILHYAGACCGQVELPMNFHYCYSMIDRVDIVSDWLWDLESFCYKNINIEALNKFEKLVKDIFTELCNSYEKMGYEYFYEVSEEDLEEFCEVNEYEFYEDGKIF